MPDIREAANDDIAVLHGHVYLRFRDRDLDRSVARAHNARVVVREVRARACRLAHGCLADADRDRPGRRSVASVREPLSVDQEVEAPRIRRGHDDLLHLDRPGAAR